MNRRGRLGRLSTALAVGMLLIATACGGGDDAGGPSGEGDQGPTGTPKPGGKLRYGLEAETDGLNPTTNRFAISAYMMGGAVFDRLALRDKNFEVKPYLAESITPSDDYASWTVKLRSGVRFHDGEPLTSEALRVHVESFLTDPLVSIAAKPILAPSNQVEIIDELTARINLSGPNTRFPLYMTSQLGMIGSPKWLTAAKANPDLNQRPVGTGPFKYKSRVQDGSTTFVRNEDYWNKDVEVYLDEIEFVIQPDPARRADQLIAGELDAMHTSDPETVKQLRDEPGINTFEEGGGEEGFVMINAQSPPFDDVRARKALTLATPKRDYLELIGQGVLKSADSMFNSEQPYYNPDVKQEADDPEGAKELAAEFCAEKPTLCSGGKIKMKFMYTGPSEANEDVANLLISGWEEVFEIDRSGSPVQQDDYIIDVAFGNYQVVTWRQFGSDDPEGEFVWLDCRNVGQPGALGINWPRLCNPERQRLLEEQRRSTDEAEIANIWQQITETINEDYLYVFLGNTVWQIAARDDVGDVIESKHPGGGVTGLGSGGYHTILQMWLDR